MNRLRYSLASILLVVCLRRFQFSPNRNVHS